MAEVEAAPKKIVVVGDSGCGKTCLLLKYFTKSFEAEYQTTVFERKLIEYKDEVTGNKILLDLWDTAGQEDYVRIRALSYMETDLVLVCFALNSKESLENVEDKWINEIKHFCKDVPRILVGMKADLRMRTDPDLITEERAMRAAKEIEAKGYVECSSYTNENVDEVFHVAVDVLTRRRRKKKEKERGCKIA